MSDVEEFLGACAACGALLFASEALNGQAGPLGIVLCEDGDLCSANYKMKGGA